MSEWRDWSRCTRYPHSYASSSQCPMGVIARYRDRLPVGPATPEVDLGEGSTPLVPSHNIGRALGLKHLYFKYEGLNPTGSFKDRGMVVAVAKALEGGSRVFMCASTGNTSASMAAYAARTGARAIVVVTHSTRFVVEKCSKALWLRDGTVAGFGDPVDVVPRYTEYLTALEGPVREIDREIRLPRRHHLEADGEVPAGSR